ncbi:MAG: 50S ribosomal protein L18 [Proteobacteria bacterium]|nr:50S ribosomal protein L18 [Pseudomonadota bacterium]
MGIRDIKLQKRERRKKSIRKVIGGTAERPRLSVYRSATNIYAQIIDDTSGNTLVAVSTLNKELKGKLKNGGNVEAAQKVGELLSKLAKKRKVTKIAFDRNGYLYHGRVKALADAAREGGLEF